MLAVNTASGQRQAVVPGAAESSPALSDPGKREVKSCSSIRLVFKYHPVFISLFSPTVFVFRFCLLSSKGNSHNSFQRAGGCLASSAHPLIHRAQPWHLPGLRSSSFCHGPVPPRAPFAPAVPQSRHGFLFLFFFFFLIF